MLLTLLVAAGQAEAGAGTINGCTAATAEDFTGQAGVTVLYGFIQGQLAYDPACFKVDPGTELTFNGASGTSFGAHPMRGGRVLGATVVLEPGSPIPSYSAGVLRTFVIDRQGLFGFYCNTHAVSQQMFGAVLVGSDLIFADDFEN